MKEMFYFAGWYATTFSVEGLSNWDTSKVTDMHRMFFTAGFDKATTWSIGDISKWNTSSVTNMSAMFYLAGVHETA